MVWYPSEVPVDIEADYTDSSELQFSDERAAEHDVLGVPPDPPMPNPNTTNDGHGDRLLFVHVKDGRQLCFNLAKAYAFEIKHESDGFRSYVNIFYDAFLVIIHTSRLSAENLKNALRERKDFELYASVCKISFYDN